MLLSADPAALAFAVCGLKQWVVRVLPPAPSAHLPARYPSHSQCVYSYREGLTHGVCQRCFVSWIARGQAYRVSLYAPACMTAGADQEERQPRRNPRQGAQTVHSCTGSDVCCPYST